MISECKFIFRPFTKMAAVAGFAAAMLAGAQTASAQLPGPVSGDMVSNDVCMQQVFGGSDIVVGSNRLNCTASDIKIAEAIKAKNLDGPVADKCFPGSTFNAYVTFRVDVTANERFDPAFFFRTDGGDNARDPTGVCAAGVLDNPPPANPPALDLDNPLSDGTSPDTCGDLLAGSYIDISYVIPDVACVEATDSQGNGLGVVKLPNCTSWHSNQSNVCQDTVTAGVIDANVSTWAPETKSKCNCDDDFTIPILIETPQLNIVKVANPTQVFEPGGLVTFTATITNPAVFTTVNLTKLTDDPDKNNGTNTDIVNIPLSSCGSTVLGPAGSGTETTTCTFTRTVSGTPSQSFTDEVCVSGVTVEGNNLVGPNCAIATVSIADVVPTAAVNKSVKALVCTEIQFEVKVDNTDTVEPLQLTVLNDSDFGNIATGSAPLGPEVTRSDCSVPQTIAISSSYTCTFDANVCSFPHSDTVTGTLSDDDGNTITPSGSAAITSVTVNLPQN